MVSINNFSSWGIHLAEKRSRNWPAHPASAAESEEIWYRGVTANVPADVMFRWLCQLRVAPYSYDWIDNFGRTSPKRLIDGLDQLKVGQRVMTIFRVSGFSAGRFLTIHLSSPWHLLCRELSVTYLCVPRPGNVTRLLVRLRVRYPEHFLRPLIRLLLPAGDLVMMRKQLMTLKALAEASYRR